ncbi:aminotransferase class I/II-fold pyridoxal phosphate-dependent enzyme [Kibdelosporangium aridum]|uniref:aminotransferase class I/II-fold pyridoxal phosphate-dependent enzyme n=1 Tax=Kibdelosporangium aridum TaxID=2030 RepID=UPI0005623A66|nr:aminotransferase class I/II-fold pyridoxal phosphate-dependent enzyme [Kibdelosporangium aridum]
MNGIGVDFTSSNYLDYRHGHDRLRPWRRLTTGLPPALGEFRRSARLAAELARRTGRSAGVLETSTLHAFVDGWAVLTARPAAVFIDEEAYPIGRIGLRANGLSGKVVRHFDPGHLSEALRRLPSGRRPVLLVDGLCPGCGRLAPLRELVDVLAPRRGVVLVDDTQAMGVGATASLSLPSSAPVVVVASAAKGYGVPLAVLTGPETLVRQVRHEAPTRLHGSGPSAAAQTALAQVLAVDSTEGARRRRILAELIELFQSGLRQYRLPAADGGRWPTQTVPVPREFCASVRASLLRQGVRTVAVNRRCRSGLGIAFLINAGHRPADVERAVDALAAAFAELRVAS